MISSVKHAHANAYDQATKTVYKYRASVDSQCMALEQSVDPKEDIFVSSTVGRFSDGATVFAQGPMVKHLALSKECFSSSPLKSVFVCVQ